MSELQYTEKFIAFVDVLGWKCHVRDSDAGRGLSLKELCDITDMLGKPTDRDEFEPTICPQARRMRKNLDFCITRHSDSVLISAEISPAGLINLVFHCRKAGMEFLSKKGIMCRGYIKRGPIYHTAEYQIGVGISDVIDQEKKASPFIEIDTEVIQYVEYQPDECAKKCFPTVSRRSVGLLSSPHSRGSSISIPVIPKRTLYRSTSFEAGYTG